MSLQSVSPAERRRHKNRRGPAPSFQLLMPAPFLMSQAVASKRSNANPGRKISTRLCKNYSNRKFSRIIYTPRENKDISENVVGFFFRLLKKSFFLNDLLGKHRGF